MRASKRIFDVIMLILVTSCGHTQSAAKSDNIAVSLDVIARGNTDYYKEKQEGFFIKTSVKNIRDTVISFVIMSCSWPSDNWITDNESIYITDRGCDGNSPTRISLEPSQTVSFYGFVKDTDHKLEGKKFKLAFLYYDSFSDLLAIPQTTNEIKKYWSNEVKLEDNLFKYRIDNR